MSDLEILPSPGRGRGVFAKRTFWAGDEVEASTVLAVPDEESRGLEPLPFLANNLYHWRERADGTWTYALPTGFALLFNHSYDPNAEYSCDYAREALVFRALRTIWKGDEVFVNYGGSPSSRDPVWFEVRK